jgi:hypothetical protein
MGHTDKKKKRRKLSDVDAVETDKLLKQRVALLGTVWFGALLPLNVY